MRIYEITDKNKTIITISSLNIDFDTEYNSLVSLLNLLIILRTPSRNQKALINIKSFEDRIKIFLENKMLDRTDPDIVSLIDAVQKMKSHIDILKFQLKI